MNLRRADSEASPAVARCRDGVGIMSPRGKAPGLASDVKERNRMGRGAGGITEGQKRDIEERGQVYTLDTEVPFTPLGLTP